MSIQGHLDQDKAFLVAIVPTEVKGGIQLLKCEYLVLFQKPWDIFCLASAAKSKRHEETLLSFCLALVCVSDA